MLAGRFLNSATLSFLGLGAQPPTPEWGAMINEGRGFLRQAPWISLAPGTMVALSVLAINLLGDGLRDALDPRLRNRGPFIGGNVIVLGSRTATAGMDAAVSILKAGGRALDAVEAGIRLVETAPDVHSVGLDAWPNLLGQSELDASLMDGRTLARVRWAPCRDIRIRSAWRGG